MPTKHFELLVEEPSMEAFLQSFLPRVLPQGVTFLVHAFQGKTDLLGKLEARLRAYAQWLPEDWRLIVLVDRDDDDCRALKRHLDDIATRAGLRIPARARSQTPWQVAHRVAIEELEAWYFGDWNAVQSEFPRVSSNVPQRQGFRDPDAISGGTWEAFERVLQKHGYFKEGLPKIDTARRIGRHLHIDRCRSASFHAFRHTLLDALQSP